MAYSTLKIHPGDNVLVALTDLRAGEAVDFERTEITLATDVPAKHKFAQQELAPGKEIIMYGSLVGKAVYAIPAGGIYLCRWWYISNHR